MGCPILSPRVKKNWLGAHISASVCTGIFTTLFNPTTTIVLKPIPGTGVPLGPAKLLTFSSLALVIMDGAVELFFVFRMQGWSGGQAWGVLETGMWPSVFVGNTLTLSHQIQRKIRSAGRKNDTPGHIADIWRMGGWCMEQHITKADVQMEPALLILKESLLSILFFVGTLGLCSLARRNQWGKGMARIWKECCNFAFLQERGPQKV